VGAGCCLDRLDHRGDRHRDDRWADRHPDRRQERRRHHQGERNQDDRRHQGDQKEQDRDHRGRAEAELACQTRSLAGPVEVELVCPMPNAERSMGQDGAARRRLCSWL